MAKYYGVALSNGETGIFTDWSETQAFIKTCPSAARYKKFGTKAEAEVFISEDAQSNEAATLNKNPERDNPDVSPEHVIAFVDGSYNAKTGTWGYGLVMFPSDNHDAITRLSGSGQSYADHRNTTGETAAAMRAVKNAIKAGYKRITIYHDYVGIAAWVTGAWDANIPMSQKYRDYMKGLQSKIEIKFVKIKAHSGIERNEMADELASAACGC